MPQIQALLPPLGANIVYSLTSKSSGGFTMELDTGLLIPYMFQYPSIAVKYFAQSTEFKQQLIAIPWYPIAYDIAIRV